MYVLFYKNQCVLCEQLLTKIAPYIYTTLKAVKFVCVDHRIQKQDKHYAVIENKAHILIPPVIVQFPALISITNTSVILYGDDIWAHLEPVCHQTVRSDAVSLETFGGFSSVPQSAAPAKSMARPVNYNDARTGSYIASPIGEVTQHVSSKVSEADVQQYIASRNIGVPEPIARI